MTTLLEVLKYHAHNSFSGESKSFYSFEDCRAFVENANESQEDFGDTNYQPDWKMFAEVDLTTKLTAKNGSKVF